MKKLLTVKAIIATFAIVLLGAGSAFASVDIGGGNGTTGPNSENNNHWKINSDTYIKIKNLSDILNNIGVSANSGDNKFSNNTKIGDIVMGGVMGHVSLMSTSDPMDQTIDLGDMGLGNVDVDLTNNLTGPNSENRNNVDISSSTTFCMINTRNINNNITADLNSGGNKIGHNTVVGDVYGGDISYSISASNPSFGGPTIIGMMPGSTDVSADMTNGTTGPNSENTNTLSVHSKNKVSITNDSTVNNNISVDANTGNTNVGHNTVVGDVTTGDASISISVQN